MQGHARHLLATSVLQAVQAIRRHTLRSFLTVLGIVIGVFSVVTMVELGKGATQSVHDEISGLGANILTVLPDTGRRRGGGGVVPPPFKPEDIEAIRNQIGGVTAVAPQSQAQASAGYNAETWPTTVNGTGNTYLAVQNWAVAKGRSFSSDEELAGKSVCLLGATIEARLYAGQNPVGTTLRLDRISCDVIGVLAKRGQGGFGQDDDDTVLMPIKAVQRRLTGNRDIRAIVVASDPSYKSSEVQQAIAALLREHRNLGQGKGDDFTILDSRQIADTLTGITRTLTAIVSAVAAISLLVGGIGIMNIMLVSVTERTREIGIRLAIGALASEVMLQFLIEAIVLSCLGGLLGLILAFFATLGLATLLKIPFILDPASNILAFVFSGLIGVVFGFFPARRASNLDPIVALRHE